MAQTHAALGTLTEDAVPVEEVTREAVVEVVEAEEEGEEEARTVTYWNC